MEPRPDSSPPETGRADRPLGRGLQDVSHLFLSQGPDEPSRPADPDPAWRVERPPPRPESTPGVILLRPAVEATRQQVAAVLRAFEGALEEGLRMIDAELPCPPYGEIDFLGIDRGGQLAIIDFETTASDDLLIRGLGHCDWVARNLPNVRRMYRGQAINFSRPPRLFLVAPRFSPRMRRAGRLTPSPGVAWVRYRLLETTGQPGIFFEAVEED